MKHSAVPYVQQGTILHMLFVLLGLPTGGGGVQMSADRMKEGEENTFFFFISEPVFVRDRMFLSGVGC
jgi:hypothetical protein